MPTTDPPSWRARAAFMREVGAVRATWNEDGDLLHLEVAPQPPTRPAGPAERMAEWHAKSVAQQQQNRHAVMFAASTSKPKFEAPPPPPSAVPRAVRAKEEAAARGKARG